MLDETFFFQDVYFLVCIDNVLNYCMLSFLVKVENTCFRVWRRNFEEGSSVFRDMFSLPSGESTAEGSSQDNPIILENIKAEDFKQFLRVMFPR